MKVDKASIKGGSPTALERLTVFSLFNPEGKKELKTHLPRVSDEITKIKLNEAVNQIENLTKGKIVKDKQVLTLMRYYEIIKEIKNVHVD